MENKYINKHVEREQLQLTLLSFLSDELSFCPTLYLAGAMWQVLEGELLVIK